MPTSLPVTRRQAVGLLAALVAFLAPLVLDVPGLEEPGERMLAASTAPCATVRVETSSVPK